MVALATCRACSEPIWGRLILLSTGACSRDLRLVGLFGAGFRVSRENVSKRPETWIGVRRRLTPDVVSESSGALDFEKRDFSVDVDCLSAAIEASCRTDGLPHLNGKCRWGHLSTYCV